MFSFFGSNNKGMHSDVQEDSFTGFVRNDVLFLIVADGMGGKEGLDSSSVMAINQFVNYIERYFPLNSKYNIPFLKNLIDGGIYNANRELLAYRGANKKIYDGLRTTFTACAITSNKEMILAHVGNSRVYILRGDKLLQLTKDHTEAQILFEQGKIVKEEIRKHQGRNILTNCLGHTYNFKYDLLDLKLNKGDLLLFCTDGLHHMLYDEEILGILLASNDTQSACETLIEGANVSGGYDNITTLISYINF